MLGRIFPKHIDNDYRGYRLAVWLLVPLVIVKLMMGGNSLFNTRDVIVGADGIPLDTFSAAVQTLVVFLFRSWALGLTLLSLLAVVALIRYRAMIPLIYLLITAEQAGRHAIALVEPIHFGATAGSPPAAVPINLVLSAICLIGLALSLGKTERNDIAH